MADPPTPTPEAISLQNQLTEAYKAQTEAMGDLSSIGGRVTDFFQSLQTNVQKAGIQLSNLGRLTSEQTLAFTAFGNALINAREKFAGLTDIDTTSINTFSAPFKDLESMLMSGGSAAAAAQSKISTLSTALSKLPGGAKMVAEAAAQGAAGILNLAKNMAANADRAIALESALMQTAAATGDLGNIYDKAGPNLENMNDLLAVQNQLMINSQGATHSSREQIERYYDLIRKVPGAMTEMVNVNKSGTETTSMLTAAIQLAHGTGMKYDDVVKDLRTSFTEYGIKGEEALRFTSRFSEISQKYGLELSDVRTQLMNATGAFKDMTNAGEGAAAMQENMAKLMNDYVQRLKDTGMTGKHAMETVQGMTTAMSSLNIAQKAFLSAQTGGPGGLMGGFQIEKMIQKGDIEGLEKKFSQTMQRQFGRIVTLEEATKSQGAAAQLEKQVMMLRQGPMGSVVKTDQDAYRFLEAMRARQEGRPTTAGKAITPLSETGLQDAMKKGSTWEEKTHTIVSDMAVDVHSIAKNLEVSSLNMVQRAFTGAAMPEAEALSPARMKEKEALSLRTTESRKAEETFSKAYTEQMKKSGPLRDLKNTELLTGNVDRMVKTAKDLPGAIRSGLDTLGTDFKKAISPMQNKSASEMDAIKREAAARDEALKNNTPLPPSPTAGQQVETATKEQVATGTPGTFQWEKFVNPNSEAARAGSILSKAPRAPAPPRGTTAGETATPAGPEVTVKKVEADGTKVEVIVNVKNDNTNLHSITPGATSTP